MAETPLNSQESAAGTPISSVPLAPLLAAAWLIPGAGHFLLNKKTRAALLFGCVFISFVAGLMMRGYLFSPQTGDLFTTLIYVGGFIGNLATGLPFLATKGLGYAQPDLAGHVHDYGTKLLVAAGLMNILAIVDAYEIVKGKKA
jgi:hypothetical protein